MSASHLRNAHNKSKISEKNEENFSSSQARITVPDGTRIRRSPNAPFKALNSARERIFDKWELFSRYKFSMFHLCKQIFMYTAGEEEQPSSIDPNSLIQQALEKKTLSLI